MIAAVVVLATLFIAYTFVIVGIARGKTRINAPAVTGHPTLERAYRVQLNTVEQAIMFFPLLRMGIANARPVQGCPQPCCA